MPIANCYVHTIKISSQQLETLVKEWAEIIEVDTKDICLTLIDISLQAGQQYKLMVNLFLPTIWSRSNIEKIQLSLHKLLKKHVKLKNEELFIITSMVPSGNVVENGQIITWE